MPKTAKASQPAYVAQVLRIEGPLGKKLRKALTGEKPRSNALALLAKEIDADRPPLWVVFEGGAVLEDVAHLGHPLFVATARDADEFFSDPGGEHVVLDKQKKATRLSEDGDSKPVKLAANDASSITAYDRGGFVIAGIAWGDEAPATVAEAAKLFGSASEALSGKMTPYEREEASDEAPAPIASSTGGSACFLGSPERRGFTSTSVTRKAPSPLWTSADSDNGGSRDGGGCPVVLDGVVYAGDTSFTARVSATDLKTGKSLWRRELSTTQSALVGSACLDRGVVYQLTTKALHALDAATGKPLWKTNVSTPYGSPVVVGERVYAGTGDGLLGFSLAKGKKEWTYKVKKDKYKRGVVGGVAARDGCLYFVAENRLFAVEISTGKARWKAPSSSCAMPSLDDDTVYHWGNDGLVAVDAKTGDDRWCSLVKDIYNDWNKSIAIGEDRVVARQGGKLVAFSKKDGKRLWEVKTKHPYSIGCSSPTIANGVVLCVLVEEDNEHPILHAVDLARGKVLWKLASFRYKKERAPLSYYVTPAVADDGTILVQTYGLQALR